MLQYRYSVEKQIVEKALNEFSNSKITEAQLKEIADFTVLELKRAKNKEDIIAFLKNLSKGWPIFSEIAISEEMNFKDTKEDEVYRGVLSLAQAGNIKSAVDLARTVTT